MVQFPIKPKRKKHDSTTWKPPSLRAIVSDKGKISRKRAFSKAHEEYEEFNKTQESVSDFDRLIKRLLEKGDGGDES